MTTPAPDPNRWKALSVCLVAGFMALLDVSVVNVALDSIRTGIDASASQLQWIVSGYALSYGLVLVPSGRLGDARGRRRVFVVGVAVFTASSLVAALAPSAGWLVVARLAQGVGGGLLSPQMSALIQELFSGAERGRAFGLLGTTIGVSTAVGPIVGGLILGALGSEAGWRWIFVLNLPIGLATIALSFRYLPAPRPVLSRESRDLDPLGVLLLGAALLAVLLPLVERDRAGDLPWAWPLAAVLLGAALVAWERRYAARGRVPVVDLRLFGNRWFRNGMVIGSVYFSGFTAVLFVLALHLQAGAGLSPLATGLTLTPFALASAVGATLGGNRVTRLGRPVVLTGLALSVAGIVATDLLLGLAGDDHLPLVLGIPLAVAGLGAGLTISPNITLTLSEVPVVRAGTAGGLLQTGQRIGTAAGIALVGAVLFGTLEVTGRWEPATRAGLRAAVALVALALAVAVWDQLGGRRPGRGRRGRGRLGRMTRTSPLVSVAELRGLPDAPTLLDVRWLLGGPPGLEEFRRGHVPGARFVDLETDLADAPGSGGRHPLPDPARFQDAMRAVGVSDRRPVVVYDDSGGQAAARAWWLLRHHGHADVRLLDGGWSAWVAAGGPVETGDAEPARGDFTASPGAGAVVDAEELPDLVRRGGVLVDARAPERYRGEAEPVDPVAGHIPGAVNVPTARNLAADGRFRPADELRELYASVGATPGTEVAVYCGSGVTAAHDVLAMTVAGLDPALYPGSWSGWITDPDRPVEVTSGRP